MEDDKRPIITGHWDKEAWVTELKNYVTTIKERYLDAEHPPVEWLSAGISMILLDQGQSAAATPMQSGIATVRNMVQDNVSQLSLICNGD